ncbi:MAG: nucleotidyltransferase domain-containing protein [Thermoguttaceae bacterium]|nr:nucleotidyltransferase domain-containing protein [Thermoguttaceae bacterium]MDW8037438.1 nucleotidyltransferase domain-containing protein [Thermoguttaceae bacterium]
MPCLDLSDILQKCKQILQTHYQSRFRGLILYGSLARQEAVHASDIDLLVLLDGPIDYFQELWTIVGLLYPVQLESERLISAKPVLLEEFEQGRIQLYRQAKREGVRL